MWSVWLVFVIFFLENHGRLARLSATRSEEHLVVEEPGEASERERFFRRIP